MACSPTIAASESTVLALISAGQRNAIDARRSAIGGARRGMKPRRTGARVDIAGARCGELGSAPARGGAAALRRKRAGQKEAELVPVFSPPFPVAPAIERERAKLFDGSRGDASTAMRQFVGTADRDPGSVGESRRGELASVGRTANDAGSRVDGIFSGHGLDPRRSPRVRPTSRIHSRSSTEAISGGTRSYASAAARSPALGTSCVRKSLP